MLVASTPAEGRAAHKCLIKRLTSHLVDRPCDTADGQVQMIIGYDRWLSEQAAWAVEMEAKLARLNIPICKESLKEAV